MFDTNANVSVQGAMYGQYMVERPGISKFFLESATEERGHAIQMMDYLNMRGVVYNMKFTVAEEDVSKEKSLNFDVN